MKIKGVHNSMLNKSRNKDLNLRECNAVEFDQNQATRSNIQEESNLHIQSRESIKKQCSTTDHNIITSKLLVQFLFTF
jgi:hypothetical protein